MLTPFELDLLKTVWPWLWSGILAAAGLYLRGVNNKIDRIAAALQEFPKDVIRIEKAMAEDRAENRHRLDRLIGDSDSRLGRIEAVCKMQHGDVLNRRAGDAKVFWARDSDVSGDALKR